MKLKQYSIKYYSTNSLRAYKNNARQHSPTQIKSIANSIEQFGFINSIVVDKNNTIIAGHGRWLAAQQLGLKTVPCICASQLTEAEIRAYRLADNKIAENAQWDESLLRVELEFLQDFDVNYDFSALGFETAEIDILLQSDQELSKEDQTIPVIPDCNTTVSKPGDCWQLGNHLIICGDCRDARVIKELMGRKRARMTVNDPPYNVPIDGHARGNGKIKHEEFMMASGEMSSDEYIKFLTESLQQLSCVSCDGSLHYQFMDWRHALELLTAGKYVYDTFMNLCVWNKTNAGMGSFYRSQHELVFVFKKGKKPHINNIELGKHGRYRTNVWMYAGLTSFGKDRDEELAIHPTTKPVNLIKDIILDASKRGDLIVDGFLGAGSTLLAAESVGRRCFGIELDPRYVDVTLERWMRMTGEMPVHRDSGLDFTELKDQRQTKTLETGGSDHEEG